MRFEKVSFETFKKDIRQCGNNTNWISDGDLRRIYDNILLPERKTKYSAGYDFSSPIFVRLNSGFSRVIPTGIKCYFSEQEAASWHLKLYVRSSLGIKYGIILRNCTGVIDADYYNNPDNEGDIMISLYNTGNVDYVVDEGERVMQGVFELHGLTVDDSASDSRKGGIGSTGA